MKNGLRSAGAAAITAAALAGCSGGSHQAAKFGGYPTFLPKDTLTTGVLHTIEDASAKKPVLASQGDAVRVHTSTGTVLATVVGPEVPNEGLPVQSAFSPATWTITLHGDAGSVPVALSAFTASDDVGRIYQPAIVAGTSAPSAVVAGQTATFKVRATIKTGEGLLRWAPDGGRQLAEWDFVVETD